MPAGVHGTHNAVPDPRNDGILVYVNGELLPREQAKISVFDGGYLIGDGVWEALRLHEGVLVFLEEHLDRLWMGLKAIDLDPGMTRDQLTAAIWKTLGANDMRDGVHVRLMLTRGVKATPSQDPRLTLGGASLVIIAEHKRADPDTRARGVALFTVSVRRGSPDSLDPRLNCHSKLHEVIALNQALAAGADEALMLDVHGFVATCNATNFFMVKNGEAWTSSGRYCMNGITRAKVIASGRAAGIPVREKDFSLTDVYDADEAFVTGTFGGLTPVHTVDGHPIGSATGMGPVTARLETLYQEAIAAAVASAQEEGRTRSTHP